MSEEHWTERLMVPALVFAWLGVIFPAVSLVWPEVSAPYAKSVLWLVGGAAGALALITLVQLIGIRNVADYDKRLARKRQEWNWAQQFYAGGIADANLLLVNRVAFAAMVVLSLFVTEDHTALLLASFLISTLMLMLDLRNRFLAD